MNDLKLLDQKLEHLKELLETNLIDNINDDKLLIISKKEMDPYCELTNLKQKVFEILKLIKKSENNQKIWDELYKIKQMKLYYLCNISDNIILQFKDAIKSIATISTNERNTIILISEYNKIYVKGHNSYGQLISKKQNINKWELIKDSKLINCEKVYLGWSYTIFVCKDRVYGAGCGTDGRIGNNSMEEYNDISEVKINEKIKKVQCGSTNSYFLTESGDIYSCGLKYYLGFDSKGKNISIPEKVDINSRYKFVDISVGHGGYHILALNSNGEVYSWGHNRVGQTSFDIKDQYIPNEKYADDLNNYWIRYPKKININKPILKISTGWGHSGLLDFDGNVYLFGRNCSGQIGITKKESKINSQDYLYNNEIKKYKFNRKIKDLYLGHVNTFFLTKNINNQNEIYSLGESEFIRYFNCKNKLINTFDNIKGIKINDSCTILIEK
jgi:alpha-tubulin suppressor-like RCC1 family protein